MKMITKSKYKYLILSLTIAGFLGFTWSCTRDFDDLELATYPTNGAVFIDGFSSGLNYAAFGGSKVTAFDVDTDVSYAGSSSMKIAVPDAGDPEGSYAGGVYYTDVGRDLSGYDALTFWAKASQPATIDLIGFGNDLGEAKYLASLSNVAVNSNWKKYIIPIPDPSKLTQERGMLFYAEGPENGKGYTFWIDEVKFEKLGTLAHPQPSILGGEDQTVEGAAGDKFTLDPLAMSFNLPTGIDQEMNIAPAYFNFSSSDESIVTVNELGVAMVIDSGQAVVSAILGTQDAAGSLTISSSGAPLLPATPAPTPTISPDSVISLFSNAYQNVTVDTWNPFWEYSTAEVVDVQIGSDDVKRYKNLNFVGILTESQQIDASEMTHFHIDIWTPDPTAPPASFKILLVDFGADGNYGGGDDSSHELSFTSPVIASETWVSLDIPLSDFVGLTNRKHIAQLVLSGDLPNLFVDNVFFYQSESSGRAEPQEAAPTPTADASNVLSLYSNAYMNLAVDTWSAVWDQAELSDIQVAGNDTKLYTGLAFAGIEFTSETIDASEMERFHMDIWTPDMTAVPAVFKVKLVDFGADGAFGGGDDSEHEITLDANTNPALASESWVGIDLALSDFVGLTAKGHLAQLIISGDPNTVYVDNVYFYKEGGSVATEPTVAAPTPTEDAANVISLFSDAYTDVSIDTWRTDWSAATLEDVSVAGNATKKYSNLDFVGIETVSNTVDASAMTTFHLDVWSADFTFFGVKLVDFGADGAFGGGDDVEHQINYEMPQQGGWVSLDIPLSDFTGLTTRSHVAQYILVGQPTGATTVYVDNVYFYGDGGNVATEPTVAAPTPTEDAANVISLFSDTYTDVSVDTWRTDWSAATLEDVSVAGNATKKYSNLDFVGIETVSNTVDASEMTTFHLDVWSADYTVFGIKLVDFGADGAFGGGDDVEHQINYDMPQQGGWQSLDIPLSDFTGLTTRSHVAQYILVGQPSGATTVYIDNVYFFKEGGNVATEPTAAAPTPAEDAANVISLFSDAYTDVSVDTWRTDWSAATLEDVSVAGNAAKKYSNLDFVGIETVSNTVDASEMTHFHIDVWSADFTFFGVKLVDFGADGAFGGGDDVEHQINFDMPQQGGWLSLDIPLSDFSGLTTRANIAQYIWVGQPTGTTTVYVDNVYFHK